MSATEHLGKLRAPVVNGLRRLSVAECILTVVVLCLGPIAYFTPTALPLLMFLPGLAALPWLRHLRPFWPVAALTAAILLLAFLRSDFVAAVVSGQTVDVAYRNSSRYFQAPMTMWFTVWALICLASRVQPASARRLLGFLDWLMIGLSCLQIYDCMTGLSLRNGFNSHFFAGHRPEMVVVRASDFNAILCFLFWPQAFRFKLRRWIPGIWLMLAAIVIGAIVLDTNAHLVMLVAGGIVFFVARMWPRLWVDRATPGKVFGAGAATAVIAFPVAIASLVHSGRRVGAHLPPSWSARIDIWSFTVRRCLEKPIWGWGYEASRRFEPQIPNHPHDMVLQAWLELGLPGLLLLAGLWFALPWLLKADPAPDNQLSDLSAPTFSVPTADHSRAYGLAALASYFVINLVSYGLWRDWLYCLGALVCAVFLLLDRAAMDDDLLR